jgi:hypothetical protein
MTATYGPVDWDEIIQGIFTHNSLLVRRASYERQNKKPRNYEEFKDKVLEYAGYLFHADKSRTQTEECKKEFQACFDNATKPLRSDLDQIIKKDYKQLMSKP